MRRDVAYLRELLLDIEKLPDNYIEAPLVARGVLMQKTDSEIGRANQKRAEHMRWLVDDGLLELIPGSSTYFRVTAKGCDFLDATRDEGIWEKTKSKVAETGGSASVDLVKQLALGFLKRKISQHTGIDL